MSKIIHAKSQIFESEVLNSGVPVFVDFWAEWCAPCRAIAPILNDLAEEYNGKVKIAKVNVDENPELADRYGIQAIPTLIVFKNGQPVNRLVGAAPKAQYLALIGEVLRS